jgi:hypothetical protein
VLRCHDGVGSGASGDERAVTNHKLSMEESPDPNIVRSREASCPVEGGFLHPREDRLRPIAILMARGLVDQEDAGLHQQRASERGSLLFSDGGLGWEAVGEFCQAEEGEQRVDTTLHVIAGTTRCITSA